MWNVVHFVLVKLVTDNVFPQPFPSRLREAQSIVLLEVTQDVVTLGYPVAQRSPKLGPALAESVFAFQIPTIDWHRVATCTIRASRCVCVDVWCVCVVRVVCVYVWGLWYMCTCGMWVGVHVVCMVCIWSV